MNRFTRRGALGVMAASASASVFPTLLRASNPINVGALRFTSHAASFVAFERGYFSDEGLEVRFEFFQAAQPMAVAVATGAVDFGVTAITGGLLSLAQLGAIRVIGGALSEEPGIDGQKILASNQAYQAGLTDPTQLAAKRFGVTQPGSSFHYMGSEIAAAGEGQPRFVPLQSTPAIIAAIKAGSIDVWSIVPHIAKALAGAGTVQIIGDVADYLPDYQVTTVFTSTPLATGDQALAAAFLRAFSRGAADYNAALVDRSVGEDAAEAMVRIIHQYVYADRPYEQARTSILDGAMRINADAALKANSIRRQLAWFRDNGLAEPDLVFEKLVEPGFVAMI